MPAPRRTLLLLLAGLAAGLLPACLTTHPPGARTSTTDAKPASPDEVASLPTRPGEVKPIRPETPTTVADKPSSPEPSAEQVEPPSPSISRRPAPTEEPTIPEPPEGVMPVNAETGLLPMAPAPPTPEPPLLAAMRAYIENRPEDAIRHLRALDRPNQDFTLAVLPLLVRGSSLNLSATNAAEVAVLVEQCHAAAARLESKASLRVEKVAFCRQSHGFGRYEPWPETQPYHPNDLAVLYVELKNVGSEPASGPQGEPYLSRAVVCLEVRDASGKLVEQTDPTDWRRRVPVARFDHADHTRSPLHDYSRTYRISVPSQPGVYTVTVEVRDSTGTRTARGRPTEFRVAGP